MQSREYSKTRLDRLNSLLKSRTIYIRVKTIYIRVKMFHFEEFDISLGAVIYAKKTTELV